MRTRLLILGAIAVVTVLVGIFSTNRFFLDTLVLGLIFAAFATAWNFAGGMTGLFSLGHGGLFAIGAYSPVLLKQYFGVPTLVGILIAAIGATLAALIIGAMSLRLRGHYFALATLAFTVIITIILTNFGTVTGGDEGISLPFKNSAIDLVFQEKSTYLYLALGLYIVTAATAIFVINSKLGFRMRALREDEVTARSMGVPALQTKLIAVMLSGVFTGLAGSVFAQYTLYITPGNTAAVAVSLQPALMAIIGGMAGIFGPLIGSMVITLLEQQLITIFGANVPGLSTAFFGGLLLISILLLPNGILSLFRMGPFRKLGDWIKSSTGDRPNRGSASVEEAPKVEVEEDPKVEEEETVR